MSASARPIVQSIKELVDALDALFKTKTIESIVRLVKRLNQASVTQVVQGGLDEIAQQIGNLIGWLQGLRDPLTQVGALSGLLGLVGPLLHGVEGLLKASDKELAKLGVGDAGKLLGPFQDIAHVGGAVLQSGQGVLDGLPTAQDVADLTGALGDLATTLTGYRNQLAPGAEHG
jgi:hypothetical protein